MIKYKNTFKYLGLGLLILFLVACEKQVSAPPASKVSLFGRIDNNTKGSPVIIWQGTRLEFAVQNASYVDLLFSRKSGQVYFDLIIGDKRELLFPENGANRIQIHKSDKFQTVTLLKRNEAATGSIAFDGIDLPSRANTEIPQRKENKLRFLFFGDAITAGACNEDGSRDQWDDMSTHNALKSYAALTAESFDAEYQNISVSGMGISMGYTQSKFPETWNKLYPYGSADSVVNDNFQPSYIFINLGENDDAWSASRGIQFPLDYGKRYISMVREMRASYPQARIVILRGGMQGGKKSKRFIEPWDKVVKRLEEEDENITHFVFQHWTRLHPRVKDHEMMAKELIGWLHKREGI